MTFLRRRRLQWLPVLLIVAASALAGSVWGGVTAFSYASEPGDDIGQGAANFYTSGINGLSVFKNGQNTVVVSFSVANANQGSDNWRMVFEGPTSDPLVAGDYPNAGSAGNGGPNLPLMSISAFGRGASWARGRFNILELVYGPGSQIVSFHVIFEQHANGKDPVLFGEIWFNATSPAPLATQVVRAKFAAPISYSYNGGAGATGYASSPLPAGLQLNSDTGLLTGQTQEYGARLIQTSVTTTGTPASGLLVLSLGTPPNASALTFVSEPGDRIGAGRNSFDTDANGRFSAQGDTNSVGIAFDDGIRPPAERWGLGFRSADGTRLQRGHYANATNGSTFPPAPYIYLLGPLTAGGTETGWFEVDEVTYGPGSLDVSSFSARFELHLDNETPAFRGTVRYFAKANITSPANATGQRGSDFTYQVSANNNPTSYAAFGLPAGLTMDAATGLISGNPTTSGFFSIIIVAFGSSGNANLTLNLAIGPLPPVITTPATADGAASQPFSFQVGIENAPTAISATELPLGLNFDPSTGLISGVPRVAGYFFVTITASNAVGTAQQVLRLTFSQQQKILRKRFHPFEGSNWRQLDDWRVYHRGPGAEEGDRSGHGAITFTCGSAGSKRYGGSHARDSRRESQPGGSQR